MHKVSTNCHGDYVSVEKLPQKWQHLRSKHWHQIEHVLANQATKKHITITKARTDVDCFTDHRLLVCKCKFPFKHKKKSLKPPRKTRKRDVRLTVEKKEKLVHFLDIGLPNCTDEWEVFKNLLQQAAKHVFDKKRTTSSDWFNDNDQEIQNLRNKRMDRNAVRNHIRELKDDWFIERAIKAEKFSQNKNFREFYAVLNQVYGPRSKNIYPIKSKENTLLTSSADIKDRWVEHFSELLNCNSEVDINFLDDLDQQAIDRSMDEPIKGEELNEALKNTKTGKTPGPDGILTEILVHGGTQLRIFLFSIITMF